MWFVQITSVSEPCKSTVLRLAWVDAQAVQQVERHAEQMHQDAADHVAVADGGELGVGVSRRQRLQRGNGAGLHGQHRLAARCCAEAASGVPDRPVGVAIELGKVAATPGAEVDLDQQRFGLNGEAVRGGDRLGGLQGATDRTAEHRGQASSGEVIAEAAGLVAAGIVKRVVGAAGEAAADLAVLGVAEQVDAGGQGSGSFLKKRTKKLLPLRGLSPGKFAAALAEVFCFFFSKKKRLSSLITPHQR